MSDSTAIATRPAGQHLQLASPQFRLVPTSLGEAHEMAKLITGSELCPKAYRAKPFDAIVAYEFGASLGLSWMQALRSVSVINGQAALWGDAVPALILGSGDCERFHEVFTGKPFDDDYAAVCTMKRKGLPDETIRSFSVADAKVAKLWNKRGREGQETPWVTYPARMLQMRARGFAARDTFPDKLSGLILVEEAMDYPDAIDTTAVRVEDATPVVDPLAWVPEGMRDNIEKAFTTLSMSVAQRLARLNEFKGKPELTDEQRATALLEWCRDEYAKRKTGQPAVRSDNRKNAPEKKAAEPAQKPVSETKAPLPAEETTLYRTPTNDNMAPPEPVEGEIVSEKEIPWGNQGQPKQESKADQKPPVGEWF